MVAVSSRQPDPTAVRSLIDIPQHRSFQFAQHTHTHTHMNDHTVIANWCCLYMTYTNNINLQLRNGRVKMTTESRINTCA